MNVSHKTLTSDNVGVDGAAALGADDDAVSETVTHQVVGDAGVGPPSHVYTSPPVTTDQVT